ncbi:uncharacterized protein GBIM_01321 [Gryllus bimaculatus]|nr:uncharacterized protein GBIM_01321 [Gryllus bimaculatus]
MPKRGQSNFDRLFKLRPLLDHMNQVFKQLYKSSLFLSIDESMVGFKGRSSLKQYMPMKLIKRGFNIWVIACAVTGYCLGMPVYEGKYEGDKTSKSLGERVVEELSSALEGLGYCFFCHFFSHIGMMKTLLTKKLFACGTIRQKTRKFFPRDKLVSGRHLKMGECDAVMSGDIGISKWKDRGKKCYCYQHYA